MPKTKRGRRHAHYRVKNFERKRQMSKPMQDITNVDIANASGEATGNFFQELIASNLSEKLPEWHVYKNTDFIEFSLIVNKQPMPSVVKLSLILASNRQWSVKVYGKPVSPLSISTIHNNFPVIQSFTELNSVCKVLNEATICEGNSDDVFIELLKTRGGSVKNASNSIVAYLDTINGTVRHQNCTLICDGLKCQNCRDYRASLRAMASRANKQNAEFKTNSSSHANYRYLNPQELATRLRNVQKERRNAERTVARLQEKLNHVIEKEGIDLDRDDMHELEEVFVEADKEVCKKLSREHFQRIFWEQQRSYNKLSNKKSMRWHPLMVRFALNLKYLSSTAYRSLQHFIALPSQRTLCDYTHVMTIQAGVSMEMINRVKKDAKFDDCSPSMKKFGILLDEMKIKSGLVFNKKLGKLVGFVDLGTINNDLEVLESSLTSTAKSVQPKLADSMLVLMIRSVMKPSLVLPIAQYPTSALTGAKLYPIVWDTIEALELNGLNVCFVSCDGLSANRKYFQIAKDTDQLLKYPFKTRNPYTQDRCIYHFCDVPHLLKTTRNCFSNSFGHSQSRMLKKGGKVISWRHVQEIYDQDQLSAHVGVGLCHKINKQHLYLTPYSKMKVYLAAQVMSSTVADALTFNDQDETTETRLFIRLVDQFFDCLNVKSNLEGVKKRKPWKEAYTSTRDERFKWLKDTFLQYFDDWESEVEAVVGLDKKTKSRMQLSRETKQGLHITVLSFCELGPKLLQEGDLKYLLSEVFSQDPLEAYFSRQRHRGGGCDNPSVQQFHYNTVSLAQQGDVYRDLRTMNVRYSSHATESSCDKPLAKRRKKRSKD